MESRGMQSSGGGTCFIPAEMERASWTWSFLPTLGDLGPFPNPAVARVSPAFPDPSARAARWGSALSPRSPQHRACRQGPAAAPTQSWAPLCPPGDGGSSTTSPPFLIPHGLPGSAPPDTQGPPPAGPGDARSVAGERFPFSQLATAGTEPWEGWVFRQHRYVRTPGMSTLPSTTQHPAGMPAVGDRVPITAIPSVAHASPRCVQAPAQGWAFLPPLAPKHPGCLRPPSLLPYISPSPFTRKYWPARSSWQPHLQWKCIRHLH